MSRQHGANLFDGMPRRKGDKKQNQIVDRQSLFVEHKEEIINALKDIRDKTTLKDWRSGITGSIQFAAKIVTSTEINGAGINDCEENGNGSCSSSCVNSNYTNECHQEHGDEESSFVSLSNMNPLNAIEVLDEDSSTLSATESTYNIHKPRKSSPIHSKTGVFLSLEIEKCIDLKLSAVSLLSKGWFLQGRKGSLLCPFVLIKLNNQEVGRTPALRDTRNPVWHDECFQFPICGECIDLTLEVWEEIAPKDSSDSNNYEQRVGDYVGKCSLNIKNLMKLEPNVGTGAGGFIDFDLELMKWRKDKPSKQMKCSCPFQEENESSFIKVGDKMRRETVRVQPTGNSFRRKRKKLPSILVEKPTDSSSSKYNFKIKNPIPYRRKDIREMDAESDSESLMNSTYFKAMFLMVVYLAIGVVGFSYTFEKWPIQDSVYFAVVTFSTVGYGDIVPSTDGAKLFSCIFALMGIGIIGIALGFIGQNLVQAQVVALQRSQRKKEDIKAETSNGLLKSLPLLRNVMLFVCPIAVMTLFGSVVVGSYEKWNWIDSIYWCVMTGTSVGYGDFVPRTSEMRWFSVVFIPLSVGCTSAALGRIANIFVEQEIAKANSKLLKREVTLEDLEIMNADGDGEVSPLEFIEHMLKVMHKVDQNLLDELHAQFEKLDADGSGGLQQDDLELLTERKLRERRQHAIEKYQNSLLHEDEHRTKLARWGCPPIIPCG
jgi:potassium channel subfamily K